VANNLSQKMNSKKDVLTKSPKHEESAEPLRAVEPVKVLLCEVPRVGAKI